MPTRFDRNSRQSNHLQSAADPRPPPEFKTRAPHARQEGRDSKHCSTGRSVQSGRATPEKDLKKTSNVFSVLLRAEKDSGSNAHAIGATYYYYTTYEHNS